MNTDKFLLTASFLAFVIILLSGCSKEEEAECLHLEDVEEYRFVYVLAEGDFDCE